jgi:hypothetical protein
MLDGFAKEYRGYVGKVMDNVCMEREAYSTKSLEVSEDEEGMHYRAGG